MQGLAHVGVGVDGVDKRHVGVFLQQDLDGVECVGETLAEVLAAMPRNQHHAACARLRRRCAHALHGELQGINHGVARHENFVGADAL